MKNPAIKKCSKCGLSDFGSWTSTSKGTVHSYCKPCRNSRRETYNNRKVANGGSHTHKEWQIKLASYDHCPRCERVWSEIPQRPDKRYKYVWTKDHKIPISKGGVDNIENIEPLCYQCNFQKANGA